MNITRWSTPISDWLYSLQPKMEKLYTVSKNKTRSWLWLRSWTPIAKIRLKKVGKTTRPFRYDLNQIPYDYSVEVRNRFKGLDLTECLKNYGQRFVTLYKKQWSRPSPRKRKKSVKLFPKALFCLGKKSGYSASVSDHWTPFHRLWLENLEHCVKTVYLVSLIKKEEETGNHNR